MTHDAAVVAADVFDDSADDDSVQVNHVFTALVSPPDLLRFEFLKILKNPKKYFDVLGLFSRLRACTVRVAASGVTFDVGSSIF